MKTIALMPVRNEAHILPYTLPPLAQICDHIIIADQHSTDDTRAVIKKCAKAILIDNTTPPPPKGRFDSARQLLLDAARNFDGNNLIICIDADELPPPAVFANIKNYVGERHKPGTAFATLGVNLWQDCHHYALPWQGRIVPCYHWLFYDHRQFSYEAKQWVHSARVPEEFYKPKNYRRLPRPYCLLHFRWAFWQRSLWQQAWYHLMEFKNSNFDVTGIRRINQYYYNTLPNQTVLTRPLPPLWRHGYKPLPQSIENNAPSREKDVMAMIQQHGVEFFEPLNIWYVPTLRQLFLTHTGREPRPVPVKKVSIVMRQYLYPITPFDSILKMPERAIRRTTWYKKLKGKWRQLREAIKKPERRIRQTTWYKKLKGKKT